MVIRKCLMAGFICSIISFLVACGSATDTGNSEVAESGSAEISDGLYDLDAVEIRNTKDGFWNTWEVKSYSYTAKEVYNLDNIPQLEKSILYFEDKEGDSTAAFIFKYDDYDNWLFCGDEDNNIMDTTIDPYVYYTDETIDLGSWLIGADLFIDGEDAILSGIDNDDAEVEWRLEKETSLSGTLEDNCEKLSNYPPHNG